MKIEKTGYTVSFGNDNLLIKKSIIKDLNIGDYVLISNKIIISRLK